jgi:hypothetical protein
VLVLWVVDHLDVGEDLPSCIVACRVYSPPAPFPFEQLEEGLRNRVAMAVASPVPAGFQIVLVQGLCH